MSFYSTPLQLGYFFALLMCLVFWYRSFREQRLSDFFLGFLFLLLSQDIQDYTFGFSGINFLWEDLNGFPRNISLLIGPTIYFYLQTQTNRSFQLNRKHLLHLVPYLVYFSVEFSVFIQGTYAIQNFQQSSLAGILRYVHWILILLSYAFYFYKSLKLYRHYRLWTEEHYSNTEFISFKWFRNFIYTLILCYATKEIFWIISDILDLNYIEDWWWNLVIVAAIFYIGLTAYSQRQALLLFDSSKLSNESKPKPSIKNEELQPLLEKLNRIMQEERLYLQPDLSLRELARHLKVNVNQLSACINQFHQQNFNDYINQLRIGQIEEKLKDGSAENFTLLAIAFDCGFNSKTTFNRAFKKEKGMSPREYNQQLTT